MVDACDLDSPDSLQIDTAFRMGLSLDSCTMATSSIEVVTRGLPLRGLVDKSPDSWCLENINELNVIVPYCGVLSRNVICKRVGDKVSIFYPKLGTLHHQMIFVARTFCRGHLWEN